MHKPYSKRKHKETRTLVLKDGTVVKGKQAKAAMKHPGSLKR